MPAALTLSQMGPEERKEGIASLEKYVQQNPKSHDARLALAQMYLASDRLDDAQKQFEIMHKNNATDLTPLMALALIKIQQKNFTDAQTYLTQYAQQAEKTPGADPGQAYIYLAQLSLEQKNEAAASDWLNKISPCEPAIRAGADHARAIARKQGKTEDARKLLAGLQAPDPRDQALIARTDAAILFDAKRYPEAEARLQQATGRFPGRPRSHLRLRDGRRKERPLRHHGSATAQADPDAAG